ncbi:MAG: Eco57I restriction-modification methylase domain-containing protein [Anaerolineae bacterium]|nr:Eco57I restriction-modification methylase domain-containing protein [Anaerolineae bacterium]
MFVEKSLEISKQYSSMIIPNKLLSAGYARATRNYITQITQLLVIHDYLASPVTPRSQFILIVYIVKAPTNFSKSGFMN